jgi:hypothetical protein
MTNTLNVPRDDLIAIIRYPEEDDPLMNPTAVCYSGDGLRTRLVKYDPETWEIQKEDDIQYSPEILLKILQTGEVEAAEIEPSSGMEIVPGEEAGRE